MTGENRGTMAAGAILILIGLVLLALQFLEGFGEAVLFVLIGGGLIAAYLYSRAYGFLIPGGILLGLGLGQIGESSLLEFGEFGSIGLGLGFCSIYLIQLIVEGRAHWWPLIPGLILIVTGVAAGSENLQRLLEVGWPLILVAIGLAILAGAFGIFGRGEQVDRHQLEEEASGEQEGSGS
jgi:hypothetical protein